MAGFPSGETSAASMAQAMPPAMAAPSSYDATPGWTRRWNLVAAHYVEAVKILGTDKSSRPRKTSSGAIPPNARRAPSAKSPTN